MHSLVYLIMALSLSPNASTREVWRRLIDGLSEDGIVHQEDVPTAGALCQRRQQLGVTPLRMLFDRYVHPIAHAATASTFRFGLRLVVVDGLLENLPGTDANRTVYPYHCLHEGHRSPFPQLRSLALMECGTHVIFDVEMSSVKQSNPVSVHPLLERSLTSDMLLLCDAGITSHGVLFQARRKGAHVLGRLKSTCWKKPLARFHDGSYLVKMVPHSHSQEKDVVIARVIEYHLKDPQTGQPSPVIRLVTTLLDPDLSACEALIQLYHER